MLPFPARSRLTLPVRGGRDRAFTLLGLAVVVFLLGVVAMFAAPALQQATREARARAVVRDLRACSAAFQVYAREKGDWPPSAAGPGAFPPGMNVRLAPTNWEHVTPVGGRYMWAPDSLHQGERYHAAIVLASTDTTRVTADKKQLAEIDRLIDDGNLDTGNFRLGHRNVPVWVLEH